MPLTASEVAAFKATDKRQNKSCGEEVAQAFKKEELKQAGEMFRKRVGHGIRTAYCAFGLRKANCSWFTDSTGKSWLDLQTRNQAD